MCAPEGNSEFCFPESRQSRDILNKTKSVFIVQNSTQNKLCRVKQLSAS